MSGSVAKGHPNKPFSELAAPKYGKGKPKQQEVKILHINVRSLRRKIDELEAFLVDEDIDLLCLTEHWLTKEEMEVVHLQGYMMRGSSERKDFTGNFDTFLESMEGILTQLSRNRQIILAGDFNTYNMSDLPLKLVDMTEGELYAELENIYSEMEQSRINGEEIPSDCESLASSRDDQESDTETTIRSNVLICSYSDSEDDIPLSTIAGKLQLASSASSVGRKSPVWSNVKTPTPPPDFTAHSGLADCVTNMTDPTPYKLFQLFFSDSLIESIVFETNLYAQQQFSKHKPTDVRKPSGDVEKNLGSRIVKQLCEGLENKNHLVYFDNFFNGVELMEDLKNMQIHACGTVNSSRRNIPKFKSDKNMKRGDIEWFTSNSDLSVIKWKDKRSVFLLSNFHDPRDTLEVNRKEKNGSITKVPCPKALSDYNANMNFVDKFDQNLTSYKIDRKIHKWWHRIFFFFLDAAVVNAFVLYKELQLPTLSMKDFRRSTRSCCTTTGR
ncbi:unnamed protein product [Acanthoscelides obtectus]|uniref:PiggyBac transposable element-derived protein domain-containing protein n=1 Tax=Acanthoscelides obtectus TaxID=200917 RepID=A0A9P0KAP8_ACAOB|nr:unnamed protein product [Acanthoscelides obtectus]CAK1656021.1 PiggyBac transposable element-derived protein 4 [Acanthoscelides obtectus]